VKICLNRYRALCWLALCLLFTSSSASAAYPAPLLYHGFYSAAGYGCIKSSANATADCLAGILSVTWATSDAPVSTSGGQSLEANTVSATFYQQIGYRRSTGSLAFNVGHSYMCPYNTTTTVNGVVTCNSTQCVAPLVPDGNGGCHIPPNCPSAGSVTYPTALDGGFFIATQSTAPTTGDSGTSFCLPWNGSQCEVKCSTGVAGPNPIASGYAVACTSLKATGAACPSGAAPLEVNIPNPLEVEPESGPGEPADPSACPPGTGFAQVNNKKMCLPSGTTGSGPTKNSTDSSNNQTSEKSDWAINGDGSTTTSTTNTVNINGQTLTSTTTNTSSSGAPGADGKDGKDIDFGPAPNFDDSVPEGLNPNLPPAVDLPAFEANLSLLSAGGGQCPAPITFQAMGQDFSIPFDPICSFAPMIKAIMLIVAGFIGLRILVMA
jgi:hypothetical protein